MSTRDLINAVMAKIPGKATVMSDPSGSGDQIVTIGEKQLRFSPLASNEEIVAALQNPFVPTANTKITMSVSGLQQGTLQSMLAQIKVKAAQRQAAGLAKIQAAHDTGLTKIDAAMDDVAKKIDSEIDAQLHEFAQSTNGGPA